MSRSNIEIKVFYANLEKGKQIASECGAIFFGRDTQIDTYFKTSSGRLKLRESSLSGAFLIPYLRYDEQGPKRSDYTLIRLEEPKIALQLLSKILGVEVVVRKTRDIYLLENIRIHLDRVDELGNFLEFEAVFDSDSESAKAQSFQDVRKLMGIFEVKQTDLIKGSYRELLLGNSCPGTGY